MSRGSTPPSPWTGSNIMAAIALVAPGQGAQGGAVVGLGVEEAGGERPEVPVVLVLACGGEGGHGAAVEAVL